MSPPSDTRAAGRPVRMPGKRAFDVVASSLGLLVLGLPMTLVAAAVKVASPGPALFVQCRVGRYGRVFRCVKFRTMSVGAARQGTVTVSGDPRITPLGRVLRRWKIDELPQLWNVLTGRMSFVGPRPDVPGYADRLAGDDREILRLRPGITGPATLQFRDEESLLASAADPRRFNDEVLFPAKVRMNRAYMSSWSFARDLGYIVATVAPALSRRTGLDRRLGLGSPDIRPPAAGTSGAHGEGAACAASGREMLPARGAAGRKERS